MDVFADPSGQGEGFISSSNGNRLYRGSGRDEPVSRGNIEINGVNCLIEAGEVWRFMRPVQATPNGIFITICHDVTFGDRLTIRKAGLRRVVLAGPSCLPSALCAGGHGACSL